MREHYADCSKCRRQRFCRGCVNNHDCHHCAEWSEVLAEKVMAALRRVDAKLGPDSFNDCMIGKSDDPVMHLQSTIEGREFTDEEKSTIRCYFAHPRNGGYVDIIFDDFDRMESPRYRKETADMK